VFRTILWMIKINNYYPSLNTIFNRMSQLLHLARTIPSTKIIDILISSECTHFFNSEFSRITTLIIYLCENTHFWTRNKIYFRKLLDRCCVRDRNDYKCAFTYRTRLLSCKINSTQTLFLRLYHILTPI